MTTVCNHYRNDIRKAQLELELYGFEEISDLPRDIYPDRLGAVVVADAEHGPRWRAMRWGFPPPPKGNRPVTNVRNLTSPFWRAWLKPEFRCLVPFHQFAEYTDARPKREMWFAVSGEQLAFFAGIWRPWTGTRGPKSASVEGEHLLYSFLTCEPNAVVKPIHSKAMPVILTTPEEAKSWLAAPEGAVEMMARPLSDDFLLIVD